MNRFYRLWFLSTLIAIPALIWLVNRSAVVVGDKPLSARDKLGRITQKHDAGRIDSDTRRGVTQHDKVDIGQVVIPRKSPLEWVQPKKKTSDPTKTVKPAAPPTESTQRPVQLPPELPENYVVVGGHVAHPTRIIARYSAGRGGSASLSSVTFKEGGMTFDQKSLGENGTVTLDVKEGGAVGVGSSTGATENLLEAVQNGDALMDKIKALKETGQFDFIEPDFIITVADTPSDGAFLDGRLWGLRNTGQNGGVAGVDINAVPAWDITTGSANVVVAIIDTGIRYTHQDLQGQMWINPDEVADNGLDDDNDGYVDNIYGIDAVNNDGDPMDDNNHGTHCAGTIGARANDGNPHVGVAWNVKLMGCKFLSGAGWGYTSGAIECVDWATANGAKVLSNSWGGGGFSQGLHDAIANARDQGVIFIAAAGNSGANTDLSPHYPSSYDLDNVISVAAMNRHGNLASWSNYGAVSVDLAAPGVEVYSSTADSDSSYANFSGTSMACPHVAGVSALMFAQHPDSSVLEMRQRLLMTVAPMDSLNGKVVTGGRVDAHQALVGGEDGDLELQVTSSANPLRGGQTASLYARVTDLIPVTGATVIGTASSVGDLVFLDDGEVPDLVAGDATYTANLLVPTDSSLNSISVEVTASKTGKNPATAAVSLNVIQPPTNDNFADSALLEGKYHVLIGGSNVEATRQDNEPAHLGHSHGAHGDKSVWFTWTAKVSGQAEINTVGSNFDTILAVYTGDSLGNLTRVASNDDGGGNWTSRVTFNAVAGTTYQIAIDGYNWSGAASEGDIQGEIIMPNEVHPVNDHFADAFIMDGTQTHTITFGSNVGATSETGEPNHGGQSAERSVWWYWTPSVDSEVKLTSWMGNGSQNPFWAYLAVYTGDTVGDLTSVARASRELRFQANAGTIYRIAVDGVDWNGRRPDQGSFRMTLDAEPRPSNDHFLDSTTLAGAQASATSINLYATKESGEPDHVGNRGGKSLWWNWTAPADGTAKIDTTGSTFDTILAIYAGDTVDNLTLIAEDDDLGENHASKISFNAVAGTTYRIAVDGKYSSRWRWTEEGQINLSVLQVPTIEIAALGEAVDATSISWSSGGNAHWLNQSEVYNNDGDAAQSGEIGNNEETWVSTVVNGESSLSFFWKVSSEENCDFLKFYIDGVEISSISGDVEQLLSFEIPAGEHTLAWAYSKDGSVAAGQDRGWLDTVSLLPVLSVRFTHYHSNCDSNGRRWLTASDGSPYYINSEGGIFRSTSFGDSVIAIVDSSVYENPRLLVWPSLSNLKYDADWDEPNRKWLSGVNGTSYYIMVDGQVYRSGNSGDELLGRVDLDRFDNPQLLSAPTVDFIQHHPEIEEAGRKWFTGIDGNRYYITDNGGVYRSNSEGEILIGGLNPDFYQSPALLTWPTVTFKEHLVDRDEMGRKWLTDISGQTYFITPSGGLYLQLEGEDLGQPFAGVSADRFENPKLLIMPDVDFVVYDSGNDEPAKKWLTDADDKWYYVGTRGDVYFWDADKLESELLGGVHSSRFQNPLLLVRPKFEFSEYSSENDQPAERWLKNFEGNWYFTSPDGGVFSYDDESGEGTLIGGVNIGEFLEPQLLIWPTVIFTQHHADQDEDTRKWFSDAEGRNYFVTPEGRVYQQGASANSAWDANLIGKVSGDLFQEADKLVVPSSMFAEYHPEWDGEGRKWFTDSNGKWHFINELGEIYQWSHPSDSFDSLFEDSGTNDGSDPDNPMEFTDSSGRGHSIVTYGDTAHTKAQKKTGNSSIYFDGFGDYLSTPRHDDWNLGNGDFTIETWVKLNSSGTHYLASLYTTNKSSTDTMYFVIHWRAGLRLIMNKGGSNIVNCRQGSYSDWNNGQWYHVAAVRSGNTITIYKDGVALDSVNFSGSFLNFSNPLILGNSNWFDGDGLHGCLDEVRLSSTARFTSGFTPSNTAFESDNSTKLLIQSGREKVKGPKVVGRLSPAYYYNPTLLTD